MRRRLVLVALAAVLPLAASAQVLVRQNGAQFTLNPFSGGGSVAGFYGYDSGPQSSSNTGLERSDVSSLLFYRQNGGPLSLVVLLDLPQDGSGGQVSMNLSGLPGSAGYAVLDDPNDTYSPISPGGTDISWEWFPCCTDGVAIDGVDPPFCIAVNPSFQSGINSWEIVSPGGRSTLPSLNATTWLCNDCQNLSCPDVLTVECVGNGGGFVSLFASGSSLCPGANIANDHTSGGPNASGFYPLGTTFVNFTLSDDPGFQSTCQTRVEVEDLLPPQITSCPAALQLPCAGQAIPRTDPRVQAWIATFQATDQCSVVTLSNNVPAILPTSCNGQPIPVLFTATDAFGASVNCTSSILIADLDPPVVTFCPTAADLECEQPGGAPRTDPRLTAFFNSFAAVDACSSVTLGNNAPAVFASACAAGHTTPVQFTALDACNRPASCTSSVTVHDTMPPSIACPTDLNLECNVSGGVPANDPAVNSWRSLVAASDACGPVSLGDDLPPLLPAGCVPGTATLATFTATDACLLDTTCSATVHVVDTTAPAITCPAPLLLECDQSGGLPVGDPRIQAFIAAATTSDLCFTASLSNDLPAALPAGCIPGAITPVTFAADDTCANRATCPSSITIVDSTAPTVVAPGPLAVECSVQGGVPVADPQIQTWLSSATASDICGTATVGHNAPVLFPSSCVPGATTLVTFSAADSCGNPAAAGATVTVADTTAPQLVLPATLQLECDGGVGVSVTDPRIQAWLGSAQATDVCGIATLNHNAPAVFPTGCGGVTTAVTFTATDDCANATSGQASVVVGDTTAPVLDVPGRLQLECDSSGGIPATDPRIQAWLALANATDLCGTATVDNDAPLLFAASCSAGPTVVTFTAVDACGNATSLTSEVVVTDVTPPQLTVPTPLTVECSTQGGVLLQHPNVQAWLSLAAATDTCATATVVNDAPALLASGCIPGTITPITFTAADPCGNESILVSTITVVDSTPPTLTVPQPLTLECNSTGGVASSDASVQTWLATTSVSDVCSVAQWAHDAPSFFPASCVPGIPTTVNFIATDGCGLTTGQAQLVTVLDTTAPELTVPGPLVLECNSPGGVLLNDPQVQAWLALVSTSDVCSSVALTNDAPVLLNVGCTPGAVTTVTFRAIDGCGNETERTQSVTVVDTTAPELTVPAPLALECNGPGGISVSDPQVQAWLSQAIATDVCSTVSLVNDAPAIVAAGCVPGAVTTVTFTATDGCGLETARTATITVADTLPPTVVAPAPILFECNGPLGIPATDPQVQAWLAQASASDICASATLVNDAPIFLASGCEPGQATVVTFTGTDTCGNTDAVASSVTVVDSIAPDVTAVLTPTLPLPAMSATSPRSVCSPPTSRAFIVGCGANDACDPAVTIVAELVVTNYDVPTTGICVARVERVAVACGEEVVIELLAPVCPTRPQSAQSAVSVTSAGVKIVTGESVVLEVTATDNCGNSATAVYDPSVAPSPLCDEVLEDGTCCPAIEPPPPPSCRETPCGRTGRTPVDV